MHTKVETLCNEFFKLMKININNLSIKCEDEERNIYFIHIETDDSKLLIWTHWKWLENIKHLLSRMIENALETNVTIHLEVNDYLKSKDDKLFAFIDSKISYVIKSQKEITLPNFSSYERKKIHNFISEKKLTSINSFSVWEWKNRVMHIAPASKDIWRNLDLDWIDI